MEEIEEQEHLSNTYELTILFSADLSEMDLSKAINKVKKSITEKDGDIKKEHNWGKKHLAYFIDKADFAHYYTFVFDMLKSSVNDIIKEIELSADILRYLNLSLQKEGIEIDDLLTPEKEAAMFAASMREKMDPKTASLRKDTKRVSSTVKPTSSKTTGEKKAPQTEEPPKPEKEKLSPKEQEKRRKDLDEKLEDLLKDEE